MISNLKILKPYFALVALLFLFACTNEMNEGNSGNSNFHIPEEFGDYWFQGKAEITSYHLQQARYGEMREGTAIAIFVTEDFSKSKQVKLDHPQEADDDAVKILKLNLTKNFITGIYPYTMMLSVFKPINTTAYQHQLKLTAGVQEWCGQTFTQLNNSNDEYQIRLYSYFESEGDQNHQIPTGWTEDELWVQIRLNPEKLPQGNLQILPGFLHQRLSHSTIQPEDAVAELNNNINVPDWLNTQHDVSSYTINYPEKERELTIYFTADFPFQIKGWEETYPDGFGENRKLLTSRAVKKKSLMTAYWEQNSNLYESLRDSLELD